MPDHIPMLICIPPKIGVSSIIRYYFEHGGTK